MKPLVTITQAQAHNALQELSTSNSHTKIYLQGNSTAPQGLPTTNDAAVDDMLNLNAFRSNSKFVGIDGSGFSTVIIDTGIDIDNPFFGPDANNNGVADRILYQYDFADNDGNASDQNGHGSNVSTIVASSDDTYKGMAPGSDIIALKVFKNSGAGSFNYVEKALRWVVANASTYNIASINMSLGDNFNHNVAKQLYGLDDELQALTDLGVIVVSPAGNAYAKYGVTGVSYPAADPNVLSVGAVFSSNFGVADYGTAGIANVTGPDIITPFSQRHPLLNDIFAPGAPITGANQSGGLVTRHGTSQASSHIAGIATLMQQLAVQELGRRLTFTEFGNLLKSTGVTINDGDDENDNVNNTGDNYKRVNVLALAQAIYDMAPPRIVVDHTLTASAASVIEGSSGVTPVTFVITRSRSIASASNVDYSLSGTAVNGVDYTLASVTGDGVQANGNTINFAPGSTSATITLNVDADTIDEIDKDITVTLSNPFSPDFATILDGEETTTIIDDDINSVISINDLTVTETDSGTINPGFTVTLSATSPAPITVQYTTVDQTATAGSDYVTTTGTLTFAPGQTSKTITTPIIGETTWEPNETFVVTLTNPTNASIGKGTGLGTILNNDPVPPVDYAVTAINPTVQEGNTGTTTNISFAIDRTGFLDATTSIKYTIGGTATLSPDYVLVGVTGTGVTAPSSTITFAPNATQAIVTITVKGDLIDEPNETISVNLSNPLPAGNTTISTASAITTIIDDDAVPVITLSNPSIMEGDTGTTPMRFFLTLSNPCSQIITVNYATAEGTATAGSDYTSNSGTVTFNPGETVKNVQVNVINDTNWEPSETVLFNANIASGNATLNTNQATGTINNNDPIPAVDYAVIAGSATRSEGDGTNTMTFIVNRTGGIVTSSSVKYAFAGTATNNLDYTLAGVSGTGVSLANGSIYFATNATQATITVNIQDDIIKESNETVILNLSQPNFANSTISTASAVTTIIDNDPLPTISVQNATVTEGDSGTTLMNFTFNLSNPSSTPVTVNYATANNTATAGTDYTAKTGTLTFAAGEVSKNVSVSIVGDTFGEPTESFFLNMSSPSNGTLGTTQAIGTINDTDAPSAIYSISAGAATVQEGNTGTTPITFNVNRINNTSTSSVKYNLSGAAINGLDYTVAGVTGSGITVSTNTINFAANATQATITLNVTGETRRELDEAINVTLSSPSPTGTTISNGTAVTTIINDDPIPTITASNPNVLEGDTGTSPMKFFLTLSNASSDIITVNYATANGTATAGSDYISTSGTVTFNPGETSKSVQVDIINDTLVEPKETVLLNLSNVSSTATLGTTQAIGNIANNDVTQKTNTLTGTANNDRLVSLTGTDLITSHGGNDRFVYNSIQNAADTITDFTVGSDKIVLTGLLKSIGYTGFQPIADGYIRVGARAANTCILVDSDGSLGAKSAIALTLVQGVNSVAMNNSNNFVF